MDQKEFLARVLPAGNHYIAFPTGRVGTSGRAIFGHSDFVEPGAGVAVAMRQANRGTDVYFALASFKQARVPDPKFTNGKASRKQENVEALKCLFLDLDFKAYDSPETTVSALKKFLDDSKLDKPSIVVNSGGGLHVYWTFENPVPFAEWQPLANGLAGLAENLGLKADLQCTIDGARILRMPGTRNLKYDPPRLCEVVASSDDVDLGAMTQRLRGVTSIRARGGRPRVGFTVDPSVTSMFPADTDDLTEGVGNHYSIARMVKAGGCPMLADMLARGGNGDTRELWNNMLLLTAYAEDGRQMAHMLSSGDPRYTAVETDAEFDMKLADRDKLGPTSCDTFSRSSLHCTTCPHRGKIKSPIVLGRPEAEPAKIRITPTFSKHGKTWRWVAVETENGERQQEAVPVFDLEMEEPTLSDIPGDARLELRFWQDGRLRWPVVIECGKMHSRDYLANALAGHSLMVGRTMQKHVVEALMSWVTLLRNENITADAPPFGWSSGGFSLCGNLYAGDGDIKRVGLTHENVTNSYGVKGKPDVWQELATALITDPRTELQILLATAFAAPLIEFTELSSTAVVIRSPNSGVGKTSVMKLARATYGDPDDMAQATDTPMAVETKLATLTNMPWYWDEVKVVDAKRMSDTIYQILQGKSKARGRPDGSLRGVHKTHGMLVMATNLSMTSLMQEASKGTDAGAYRVFELELMARPNRSVDSLFSARMGKLHQNYGHAGVTYAAYLASHRAEVEKVVDTISDGVDKTFGTTEAERYWTTSVKVILAGAILATKAGICRFDVPRMADYLKAAIGSSRTTSTVHNAPEDLASRIWRFFANRSLITDVFHPAIQGKPTPVTTEPPIVPQIGSARVRLAYATNDLLISRDGVRDYARYSRDEPELLCDQLRSIGQVIRTPIDKGVSRGSKSGREYVYLLKADDVLGAAEMQEWINAAASRSAASHGSSSGSAPSGSTAP